MGGLALFSLNGQMVLVNLWSCAEHQQTQLYSAPTISEVHSSVWRREVVLCTVCQGWAWPGMLPQRDPERSQLALCLAASQCREGGPLC